MSTFENRLSAYKSKSSTLDVKRKTAGALGAALAVGAVGSSHAAIVHTPGPIATVAPNGTSVNSDSGFLNPTSAGFAVGVFNSTTTSSSLSAAGVFAATSLGGDFLHTTTGIFARLLGSGATISAGAAGTWFGSGFVTSQTGGGNNHPSWNSATQATGFVGFRFDPDGAGPAGFNYGWMQVQVTPGNPAGLSILQAAYDDGGLAILAGDIGGAPVPEPSTGLMALAMGAAGIAVWRRRRQQEKDQKVDA